MKCKYNWAFVSNLADRSLVKTLLLLCLKLSNQTSKLLTNSVQYSSRDSNAKTKLCFVWKSKECVNWKNLIVHYTKAWVPLSANFCHFGKLEGSCILMYTQVKSTQDLMLIRCKNRLIFWLLQWRWRRTSVCGNLIEHFLKPPVKVYPCILQ